MTSMNPGRWSALAVLCAVTVSILAGCDKPASPTVATAQRPTSAASAGLGGTPSASPSAKQSGYDKALQYARCMNANGTKMSDPVVGKPLQTGDLVGPPGNQFETAAGRAFNKCKQLLPETWPVKVDPAQIARDKPFDDCLQRHGIKQDPTLTPDANGMVHYPTDPTGQDTPEFRAAVAACRYLVDDPANNQ